MRARQERIASALAGLLAAVWLAGGTGWTDVRAAPEFGWREPPNAGGDSVPYWPPVDGSGYRPPEQAPGSGAAPTDSGGDRYPPSGGALGGPGAVPPARYRFRGDADAVPWTGSGSGGTADDGYRFRPLDDQEQERLRDTPGWRPPERSGERGVRPPGLMDALIPPGPEDGQAPPSWR